MKALLALSAAVLLTGSAAQAADLPQAPSRAPAMYVPVAAPVYNWSGFYVGLNAGYGFADASATASAGGLSASTSENLDGFVGGGQIGVNYQAGPMVFGIEGDFDGTSQNKTTTFIAGSDTNKIPWIGTVRGRIGVAVDRVLFYGTGGVGWGEFQSDVTVTGGTATGSQTHAAWVAGAGVEAALAQNWTARLEYLYLDTGNLNLASIGPVTVTGKVQDNIVRAGVNYKFNF